MRHLECLGGACWGPRGVLLGASWEPLGGLLGPLGAILDALTLRELPRPGPEVGGRGGNPLPDGEEGGLVLQGIARYCRVLQGIAGSFAGYCRAVLQGIAGYCRGPVCRVLQGIAGPFCRVLQGIAGVLFAGYCRVLQGPRGVFAPPLCRVLQGARRGPGERVGRGVL